MCFLDLLFDPVDIQIDRSNLSWVNKSHRTNKTTYERTNKSKTYERTNEWINEKKNTNERTKEQMHTRTHVRTNKRLNSNSWTEDKYFVSSTNGLSYVYETIAFSDYQNPRQTKATPNATAINM